jgi:hypothetical protein
VLSTFLQISLLVVAAVLGPFSHQPLSHVLLVVRSEDHLVLPALLQWSFAENRNRNSAFV